MLNIKALALAATLSVGSIFSGAAQAAPTTCALRDQAKGEVVTFTCDHSLRTNANGHVVNDVVWFDNNGNRTDVSIIWWLNNGNITYAEMFADGNRHVTDGYKAQNGSWCVSNNGMQLCVH